MRYFVDQFPSTAFRLKDIRHQFISAGFELFNCVFIVNVIVNGERRQLLSHNTETHRELPDLAFCVSLLALGE